MFYSTFKNKYFQFFVHYTICCNNNDFQRNDSIDYDHLTYDDIFSAIKKLGINMCNDEKLLKYHLQNKKKAKI